jgi:hypothetical protein
VFSSKNTLLATSIFNASVQRFWVVVAAEVGGAHELQGQGRFRRGIARYCGCVTVFAGA